MAIIKINGVPIESMTRKEYLHSPWKTLQEECKDENISIQCLLYRVRTGKYIAKSFLNRTLVIKK